MRIFLLCFTLSISALHSQDLHHQALSSQGASKELPNGMYVSQTIGQQSVIGNYTKDGKTYGQGYQQSVWSKYIQSTVNNPITTVTYPNPFVSNINFQFSQLIKEQIKMELFDVRGRLIFQTEQFPTDNLLTVALPNLASSNYLVKLTSSNYTYYTQILKQE
ncbi:T9SS type A sorting domain-containing protein [Flavobacterium sp.]|uniref:T9SS type A sorting domain-containing protein n=1 Tax=Flavobacterium sp. TaxID=239 RepID=UPI002586C268|nr:T9SS type A sorting domain-containing protein [Flavobacterium sp.]